MKFFLNKIKCILVPWYFCAGDILQEAVARLPFLFIGDPLLPEPVVDGAVSEKNVYFFLIKNRY